MTSGSAGFADCPIPAYYSGIAWAKVVDPDFDIALTTIKSNVLNVLIQRLFLGL